VTLQAGGAHATRTLEVRGDPGKPAITLAEYKQREAFLLDVLEVQRALVARAGQANAAQELRRLIQRANTLAADFNGSGSRPGTLYGPTAAQKQTLEELRRAAGATAGVKR
jgi:hypothetical protein